MKQLSGKVALITGATTGIGFATAKLFIEAGAKVIITGQDSARLDTAKTLLGDNAHAALFDVRNLDQMKSALSDCFERFGQIDILFANAGVAFATPLAIATLNQFDDMININLRGVFFTIQHSVPHMREGASIILNTSWLNQVGTNGLSLLSASKAAVRSLARTLSAELLPNKIRVNAISPGAIETPIHGKTGMTSEQLMAFAEQLQQRIPLKRFGLPIEIANAALFLASDASSYMLGAEIVCDGGFSQL